MRLCMRRGDGTLEAFPRFGADANPLRVRAYLLAFYEIRDLLEKERLAVCASGTPQERVTVLRLVDEVRECIEHVRDCLTRIARRGGRGQPPPSQRTKSGKQAAQPLLPVIVRNGATS